MIIRVISKSNNVFNFCYIGNLSCKNHDLKVSMLSELSLLAGQVTQKGVAQQFTRQKIPLQNRLPCNVLVRTFETRSIRVRDHVCNQYVCIIL